MSFLFVFALLQKIDFLDQKFQMEEGIEQDCSVVKRIVSSDSMQKNDVLDLCLISHNHLKMGQRPFSFCFELQQISAIVL
jgi:hypothetical protein